MRLLNTFLLAASLVGHTAAAQNPTDSESNGPAPADAPSDAPQPKVITDQVQADGVATHRIKLVFKEKGTGVFLTRVEVSAGSVKL